ncbi:ABC transporter permease [Actinoplanes sp. NPDC051513]|uniref:ABC transporter permease n=1 Tax=Actinoplanes sp. NPDC051513 TaxID=3363908 RepID=UPI00379CBFF2
MTSSTAWIVAGRELRELWCGGRGPLLLLAFSVLLSVITYLAATNQVLNFLEQREAVNLVLKVAIAVGALVTLVLAADGVSGERERATLEALLVTPARRPGILLGKWLAAMSWWFAGYAIVLPYLWVLGRGVSAAWPAIYSGLLAGTILAAALSLLALLISCLATTNRTSLGASLLLLLALFAPTQLPRGLPQSWFGDLLSWLNPVSAALRFAGDVVVTGHAWNHPLGLLLSPALIAVLAAVALRAWGAAAMANALGRTHE